MKKLAKLKLKEDSKKLKDIQSTIDPEKYYDNRVTAIQTMKNTDQTLSPYPHHWNRKQTITELYSLYESQCTDKGIFIENINISTAGRILSIRNQSKKLYFIDIESEGKNIQIILNESFYQNKSHFTKIIETIKRGDIIGIEGHIGKSISGQFSIRSSFIKLLSPCLRMLPQTRTGISDSEIRYRQRYLDLLVNPSSKDKFLIRSRVIQRLRQILVSKGFLEVETPVLNSKAGGANARPFSTVHNELKQEMHLRVAPELFLKQLIVGGFEKVFEIGKNFRNEGIDTTHNPEFTSCELYSAYEDYNTMMDLTEEIICNIIMHIKGSLTLTLTDHQGHTKQIDFTRPWKRISMIEHLEQTLSTPFPQNLNTDQANKFFIELCKENNIECPHPQTTNRLINKLSEHFIESSITNPTFIIDQPQIMCPLAKSHRDKPYLTERFELFVDQKELVNSYTELNDPFEQYELFVDQVRNKQKGDLEANEVDHEYVLALEYGLPPTAGWGIGVDRLCMLLTDSSNIQEVILFPAMKPKQVVE